MEKLENWQDGNTVGMISDSTKIKTLTIADSTLFMLILTWDRHFPCLFLRKMDEHTKIWRWTVDATAPLPYTTIRRYGYTTIRLYHYTLYNIHCTLYNYTPYNHTLHTAHCLLTTHYWPIDGSTLNRKSPIAGHGRRRNGRNLLNNSCIHILRGSSANGIWWWHNRRHASKPLSNPCPTIPATTLVI